MTLKLTFFILIFTLLTQSCTTDEDLFFIGKWQSLNDYSSLVEFTSEKKIILFRNEKSFWTQITEHGELNFNISKQRTNWYKIIALDGDDIFLNGRIEIVDQNRIRIYFHKHHDILDVADEYYRTDSFNNLTNIMNKLLNVTENQ